MPALWFCIVALMVAIYVILDGFDLGAGIVHMFAARTDSERRQVLASIGPFWDGNEVWLLAAGGTLYFAFPTLYASSFSGFYLPLMIVLWLLVLRGIAIEFRSHVESPVWAPAWDVTFASASALLAIFFGAALGNVVRGVPLDANAEFFLPLWTNFAVDGSPGILDYYTISTGLLAFAALTQHGALWVAARTNGDVRVRSERIASWAWWAVGPLTVGVTCLTWIIQPQVAHNLAEKPWGWIFPALAATGLAGAAAFRTANPFRAFYFSCAYLAGMLTSAAFGVFPNVLPARPVVSRSLTIYNTATSEYGMSVGILWWIPGMILAAVYFTFLYRRFATAPD